GDAAKRLVRQITGDLEAPGGRVQANVEFTLGASPPNVEELGRQFLEIIEHGNDRIVRSEWPDASRFKTRSPKPVLHGLRMERDPAQRLQTLHETTQLL